MPPTCPAPLAVRDRSDWGTPRICGCKAVTAQGFCRRHDPETKPQRDTKGRILPLKVVVVEGGPVTPTPATRALLAKMEAK